MQQENIVRPLSSKMSNKFAIITFYVSLTKREKTQTSYREWNRQFWTTSNLKRFYCILDFLNLYEHTKIKINLWICCWDIANLKMLQSHWPRAFWPKTQEQELSQIWNLCRSVNNLNFHYRLNVWST